MAPKKNIYKVRSQRCVVLPTGKVGSKGVNWAKGGDYIDLSNPKLAGDLEGQMHMLTKVDKLPRGEKVRTDFPTFYERNMRKYDRAALSRAVDLGAIDVDGPLVELQGRVDSLQAEVERLKSENDKLKKVEVI